MKKIAISMRNRVFMESISLVLKQTDEFRPICIPSSEPVAITEACLSELPDIIFMDVVPALPETGIEARLGIIRRLHEEIPDCKSVLLCDETSYPELAEEVMRARQRRRIDGFFYASVTTEYMKASLNSL